MTSFDLSNPQVTEFAGATSSVSSAGDFNGDGFDDVVVGARHAGENQLGAAYLIFGSGATGEDLQLGALDGTRGFRMTGNDILGIDVGTAGDFNNDGLSDIFITGAGACYLVFGTQDTSSVFGEEFDLNTLTENQGLIITSPSNLASTVASAGDFNNDGFDDIIIGVSIEVIDPETDVIEKIGSAYVIFGTDQPFAGGRLDLTNTLSSSQGFKIDGIPNGLILIDVASAGDFNNDGFDDIIISCHGKRETDFPLFPGAMFVVYGTSNPPTTLELSTLTGTKGFRINGITRIDLVGFKMASADFNNDGFDDLLLLAPYTTTLANITEAAIANANEEILPYLTGSVFVVYGTSTITLDGGALELSALNTGNRGFRIDGVTDGTLIGSSVANAGDLNHDGFDDVIIGIVHFATITSGVGYVVFGTNSNFNGRLELSQLLPSQGYRITQDIPNAQNMFCTNSAGDYNNDGFADLAVGSYYQQEEDHGGSTFIIFGKAYAPTFKSPTNKPTRAPTMKPTTRSPSEKPTRKPTQDPATTRSPSLQPTTRIPTEKPTRKPTQEPTTRSPSNQPTTRIPTEKPTRKPTLNPTTRSPTNKPTTRVPTEKPTRKPTPEPTTRHPTNKPTTRIPTEKPTRKPTLNPTTRSPTNKPTTRIPTEKPTRKPTHNPTTRSPSNKPTTRSPSRKPLPP